ncbi:MAG: hypothetical protein IH623_30755 [Verrucomicrobia bacterium]|nr:hypothetical protein [Verrucomicrobiota bacterium]
MKRTRRSNQVCRENNSTAAKTQPTTSTPTPAGKIEYQRRGDQGANQASAAVMLEFHADQSREVISRTEIAPGQFRSIKAAAKVAGLPVEKFLENGIGAKLRQLEAELVSPNFSDPLSVLLGQLCRQFPDSIQKRKTLLRSLLCVLTDEHPASPAVQAQLIVLESLDVLDRDLPGKFSGAAVAASVVRRDGESVWERAVAR